MSNAGVFNQSAVLQYTKNMAIENQKLMEKMERNPRLSSSFKRAASVSEIIRSAFLFAAELRLIWLWRKLPE